jgi:uncharacterized membrane protein
MALGPFSAGNHAKQGTGQAPSSRHVRFGALTRLLYATAAGLGVGLLMQNYSRTIALLGGWNAAGIVLLGLSWITIGRASAEVTECRAGTEDPGRSVVYFLVLVASTISFFAAVALSREAKTLSPDSAQRLSLLCLATVAVSWALLHTAFTLRYGHLFYRDDAEGVGGVDFPGKTKPSYFDFAYFSFTIGMCFQTSDVCVTSPQIRRTVLLHAVISFAYNTAILAFVLNLVLGQV